MAYDSWAGPARQLARSVDAAIRSAVAGDADAFDDARDELRRVEPEVIAVLLGAMSQQLIERTYPDGLDADDAQQVLGDASRAAAWFESYDDDQAAVALLGALALLDPEQAPAAPQPTVIAHGLLLIASLLPTPRELPPLLDTALRELHRAQTVELP